MSSLEIAGAAVGHVHPVEQTVGVVVDHPRSVIGAAMILGGITMLAIGTAPIVFAALVAAGRLSNQTMGQVSTLELLGVAAGAVFGPRFLRVGAFRGKLIASLVALAILNLVCTAPMGEPILAALRTACGLLEGGVLAGAILILVYVREPERMNGYFLAMTTIPQIIASYVLSSYAIAKFGEGVWFEMMAGAAVLGIIASFAVSSSTLPRVSEEAPLKLTWTGPAILGACAILMQNAAIGATFNYIVQIASEFAISGTVIGLSLSALQVTAVVSALAVAIIGWRLPHAPVLVIGCLAQAALALGLGGLHHPIAYLALCALFGFSWNALLPFSLKLLIKLDPTRQLALLSSPLSLTGLGLGPFIASLAVTDANVERAFQFAAGMFALSGALYLGAHLWTMRRRKISAAISIHGA